MEFESTHHVCNGASHLYSVSPYALVVAEGHSFLRPAPGRESQLCTRDDQVTGSVLVPP